MSIIATGSGPPTGKESGFFYVDTSTSPNVIYILSNPPLPLEQFRKAFITRENLDKFADTLKADNPSLKVKHLS